MTKAEMIGKIAGEMPTVPKKTIETIVGKIFGSTENGVWVEGLIADELAAGNTIEFRKFGTFMVKKTGERKVRNPQNGNELIIAAKAKVRFKSSKELTKALNR